MAGVTKMANITTAVRDIDFVTQFQKNWDALNEVFGIMRPIRKTPGTKLTSYKTTLTLESGAVPEANTIPFSVANISPVAYGDIEVGKYGKSVSLEAVAKYGAPVAIARTDEEFRNELQSKVMDDFYKFLETGSLLDGQTTFQAAFAMAQGLVRDKFKKMHRDVTAIVQFVNILDAYEYLGAADITVQTQGGLNYLQNFMGASNVILSSEVPRGKVIATPVNNIDLYYIDPADSDFAQMGLDFTVAGETNLIGFHSVGNYTNMTGEAYAIMGMKLWAEYLDGISVVYIGTPTKVTTAETITAESAGSLHYPTAHGKVISVQELKDGNTVLTADDYTIVEDGIMLKESPTGTVTIKYTYVA